MSVELGHVQAMAVEDDVQAVGTLRAQQSVVLKPEVSGRVVRIGFADGQRVRKGQVLVQLDDSLQAAQLQQAEAQAAISRTQLQRNRELLAQSFVSASVVDQAQAALQVAEAQVALSRAQLERMRLLAPFDGAAGIRTVNLGDYVKDGSELVNLEDASTMWVDFRLPERDVPRLRRGQPVEVSLDALPGQLLKAEVEATDALVDVNGRSLLVRARLKGNTSSLRSGLFARVRLVFSSRPEALMVPEEALVPQGGKQFVIKAVEGPNGLVAQKIEAKLGLRQPGRVELLGGVKPGDRVVTAGHTRLNRGDGQALKAVEVAGAAPVGSAPSTALR
ncbi:efflux RND transporter periplasmic adaptor subunit [Paucibacter sp. JuS9]|uniref:efflux RND transporter periplasmic adaptor subunit n=1 Tax=Roseateles TaxID=93681 RepID=UPI002FE6B14D